MFLERQPAEQSVRIRVSNPSGALRHVVPRKHDINSVAKNADSGRDRVPPESDWEAQTVDASRRWSRRVKTSSAHGCACGAHHRCRDATPRGGRGSLDRVWAVGLELFAVLGFASPAGRPLRVKTRALSFVAFRTQCDVARIVGAGGSSDCPGSPARRRLVNDAPASMWMSPPAGQVSAACSAGRTDVDNGGRVVAPTGP